MAEVLLSMSTIAAVDVTAGRVVHPVERVLAEMAGAGLRGVGLDWFSLRDAERRGVAVESLADAADELGTAWTDLAALRLDGDASRDQPVAASMARRCAALKIGSCALVISVRPDRAVYDRVARCAEQFAAHGVRLALEFMPYSEVRDLAAARAICQRVGTDACGVLVDTLHLTRSGGSVADLHDLDRSELAAVQIADCLAPAPPDLAGESRDARLVPGTGVVDFAGLRAAIDAIGWSGVVSAEVLSRDLRARPLPELVGEVVRGCRRALRSG